MIPAMMLSQCGKMQRGKKCGEGGLWGVAPFHPRGACDYPTQPTMFLQFPEVPYLIPEFLVHYICWAYGFEGEKCVAASKIASTIQQFAPSRDSLPSLPLLAH